MKKYLLYAAIINTFIMVILFMMFFRLYPFKVDIDVKGYNLKTESRITSTISTDYLSNMYQVIITILTILLGISSVITFIYSKNDAENAMHDLVKSQIVDKVRDLLLKDVDVKEQINNTFSDNSSEKIDDLQKQINKIKNQLDEIEEKLDI